MKARDHTLKLTDYDGRWAEARDATCPCRPCWRIHAYHSHIVTIMRCWTREQDGCPHTDAMGRPSMDVPPPTHLKYSTRAKICKRCGQRIGREPCVIVPR